MEFSRLRAARLHYPLRICCKVDVLVGFIGDPKMRSFSSCRNDEKAQPGFLVVVEVAVHALCREVPPCDQE